MKQVTRRGNAIKKKPKQIKQKRQHQKYGTSKLEEDFAKNFLDRLGVKYTYQYEAKNIGRFYDFAVLLDESSGLTPGSMVLIEIDGDYFHSNPAVVEEGKMNPMQKRNKRVDEYKNKWALLHGIPLIRIWEKDIRQNPSKVMKELKERLYLQDKTVNDIKNKNKRHVNKIK